MSEGRKKSIRDEIQELKDKTSIDEFNKKRDIGENDHYICYLIQNDLIIDFITYKEKNIISPTSTINLSMNVMFNIVPFSTYTICYAHEQNLEIKFTKKSFILISLQKNYHLIILLFFI